MLRTPAKLRVIDSNRLEWDAGGMPGAAFPHSALAASLLLLLAPDAGLAQSAPLSACLPRSKPMARLELLFGAGSKGGKVSPRAFAHFIATEVTPRFPDGLSLFEGRGQWRDESGRLVREASRLLLIWHAPDPKADARIEAIRAAYKKRFKQQSVMRVDGVSCVSF